MNLPKFELPANFDEQPLREFQAKLLERGYDVKCKSTLAFFLVGRKYRLQKAIDTFLGFIEYVESDSKESPTEIQAQDYIHGYCQQPDGTLCTFTSNYMFDEDKTVMALCRQSVVYILANLTFDNMVNGYGGFHDAQGFGWQNFNREAEELGTKIFLSALPLRFKHFILVDAPWWISIVMNICRLFTPKKVMDKMKLCSRQDVAATAATWKIPTQLGGTENFKKLPLKFIMEYPYLIEGQRAKNIEKKQEEIKH